eukprot:241332_1
MMIATEEEKKYATHETYDNDSEEDTKECIIDPGNDRRKIICDSFNRNDGIIQCIGTLETTYIPDPKLKKTEKMCGTGTVIHCDDTNKIYILTTAHNVRGIERECVNCQTKTLAKQCSNKKCDGSTTITTKLIKPKDIWFTRRGIKSDANLGQCIEQYEAIHYKIPELYETFSKPYNGYDICLVICQCSDKDNINIYKQNCRNICLVNDTSFGGKQCRL